MYLYHTKCIYRILIVSMFALLLMGALPAGAQAQLVSDLPPDKPNSRFMTDLTQITMRPGLTIAGFAGENSRALGLKQILNQAAEFPDGTVHATLGRIFVLSRQPLPINPNIHEIEYTSNILQYLAFETLTALILEQNGITAQQTLQETGLPVRSHETLMPMLSSALSSLSENDNLVPKLSGDQPFEDYLDALRSYNNIARAVDLYLGIENAYSYYDLDESPLLTQSEKQILMDRFAADLHILYHEGIKQVHTFADGGITALADELEAGNRPLKAYLALGYVSLSLQSESESEKEQFEEYISMAIEKASKSVQPHERDNYWMYQTGNGQPFWAEGPYYFDYVLKDAIAFWHVVRELKGFNQPSDPFSDSWFLNPVHWLAAISTPDGSVPPLDDGNKRPIQAAPLLRWTPEYGDRQTGEYYAGILDKIDLTPSLENEEDQFYLIEAAIPRIQTPGAAIPSLTDTSGQQLVIRTPDADGGEHYFLLNGEHGQAITAGEGHEQPDQLQLLYYRDQHSYLVDPGYDRGFTQTNSTWNGYLHTNTMQYNASDIRHTLDFVTTQNEGGLQSPFVSETEIRKVSNHAPAFLSYTNPASEVEFLSGTVELGFDLPEPSRATYHRSLIVVKGDQPYLIDINDVTAEQGRKDFVMRYHGNSPQTATENGWFYWHHSGTSAAQPGHNLFLYTHPLIGNFSAKKSAIHILETENRNAAGEKESYPIVRKSLESNEEGERFVTAGILQIGEAAPEYEPQFFRETPQINYFWKPIDSETSDLFLFNSDTADSSLSITIGSGPAEGLSFALAPDRATGFTRLKKANNEWHQMENYTAYLTRLSPPGGEDENEEETHGNTQFFNPFPNPARQTITFKYLLKDDSEITMAVYDLLGRNIQTILNTNKAAGLHEEIWNPDGLSSGVYMIQFTAESDAGTTYQKMRKISLFN